MTFEGHIQNGVAVFDQPVNLPEGLKVRIEPVTEPAPATDKRPTLAERFKGFIGTADDLPADMAQNHDQYLHDKQ
jgi:hypothetical protein